MTKYLAIGMVILVMICAVFFYRGQVYRAKLKTTELALKVSNDTIVEANKRINTIQTTNAKAIKKYQKMIDECLATVGPCQEVVITGCPTFTITKEKGKDPMLDKLRGEQP